MKQVRRTVVRDGKKYQSVIDEVEIDGDIRETDDGIAFDVVLAKEIVQPYQDHGKVYKPADELEKAADVSGSVYITDGHPPAGIVRKQDQVYGQISADSLTFNEEDTAIEGTAEVFTEKAPDNFVQEIKDGDRDSVSIGFYTQLDNDSGSWNDEEYDKIQRDILLDHLAVLRPQDRGRCSVEAGCGIKQNMDQATVPLADRQEPEDDDDPQQVDIAYHEKADAVGIMESLTEDGYDVEVRPCNCGDHEGHITVLGSPDSDEDKSTYLNQESKSMDRGSGVNFMEDIESIDELDFDDLKEHSDVQDLIDEKESLEDEVSDLEEKVEDLEETIDEFEESQADELREKLTEDYGLDEERVEDMDLDELETVSDTLSEADLVQKDVTGTSPGQENDSKSDNTTVGTGGSGPHADDYGSDEE